MNVPVDEVDASHNPTGNLLQSLVVFRVNGTNLEIGSSNNGTNPVTYDKIAGILSLGHGLYFALGGYAFGMYLMRESAGDGLPDFMRFLSWTELPWYWVGTEHFAWAMILVLSVPALVAFIFGFFAFRSKIKGVYFSIITQAMTFAAALLFFRNETGFGGNNGFTGFKTLLGFDITSAPMRASLCFVTALVLMLCFIGLRQLMNRPYGRVLGAIRDSENRLQYGLS